MHELTIAQNIIEIVAKSLSSDQYAKAESVKIRMGFFSNILPEALITAFNVIKRRYNLNHINLEIEIVPLTIKCNYCLKSVTTKELFTRCSYCDSDNIEITNGDILEISEITLTENA